MSAVARVADAIQGTPGHDVLLDGRASTGASIYLWEVLNPVSGSSLDQSDQPVAVLRSAEAGEHVVRLTVSDSTTQSAALTVVRLVPWTAVIDGPTSGQVKAALEFDGSGSLVPDGATFSWEVVGPADASAPFIRANSSALRAYPRAAGTHTVTLVVLASDGKSELARSTTSVEVSDPGEQPGGSPDEAYWQKQQLADQRAALANVKAAATTWQSYTAGLLGLFSTVALVAGPKTITDVKYPLVGWIAMVCVGLAFLAAVRGIYLLSKVTAPRTSLGGNTHTASEYQEATLRAAHAADLTYASSKKYTIGAALLIAVGSLAVAAAAFVPPSAAVSVLVRTANDTLCGELITDGQGRMTVAGNVISGKTEAVTVVASCGAE